MHLSEKNAAEDPTDFLSGKSPFSLFSAVSESLLDGALDSPVANQIAKGVCLGIVQLFEQMVQDQLPGGKYYEATQELIKETQCVIPHNKLPEFAFEMLDRLVSFRPNATTLANEAKIMYNFNQSGEWLSPCQRKNGQNTYRMQGRKETTAEAV